jgi:beta-galactosidase
VLTSFSTKRFPSPAPKPGENWARFVPVLSLIVLGVIGVSCSGGTSATSNNIISNAATSAVTPSVTAQPMSQTVTEGQPAVFSVSASGTAPLNYQWTKNGAAISGATGATYTTPASTPSDQGAQFSVTISNSAGSTTSSAATLTVEVPFNFVVDVPSTTPAGSGKLTVTAQIGGISHTAQMTLTVQ